MKNWVSSRDCQLTHCTFNSTVNKHLPEKFCLLIERNRINSQYKDSWQLQGNPFQLQLQKEKIKFILLINHKFSGSFMMGLQLNITHTVRLKQSVFFSSPYIATSHTAIYLPLSCTLPPPTYPLGVFNSPLLTNPPKVLTLTLFLMISEISASPISLSKSDSKTWSENKCDHSILF